MPKKDLNQLAKFLVDQATGEAEPAAELTGKAKAGQAGGLKGGNSRAKKLTSLQRTEIAKKAAKVRWET